METAPELLGHTPEAVTVEVELDPDAVGGMRWTLLRLDRLDSVKEDESVTVAMSLEPLMVGSEDTLGEVAEKMLTGAQTCVVVCDHKRVIGILTTADILRACAMRIHSSEARVRQWMTAEPLTISPETSLSHAELLMREYGVHHLPVVENDKPIGVLHAYDRPSDRGGDKVLV